jgi:VWFA-related protein
VVVQQDGSSVRCIAAAVMLAVVATAALLAVQRDQPDTGVVHEAIVAVGQSSAPGQAQPQFRTAVNLVRVDVYATTGSGPALDLGQNDFEVYESGVLQKIESFEQVVSRVPVPEFERVEPRSDEEAQDAVADLRNRLFVVLFDTLNTVGYRKGDKWEAPTYDPTSVGSALTSFLQRSIGEDDLVAVMDPEMLLSALRFTRRPSRFDQFLRSGAEWERRFAQGLADDAERQYDACYATPLQRDIFLSMVARRREMRLLDTLRGLAAWLGALREGRKAVFVVSEGWELYRPDQRIARPLQGQVPLTGGVGRIPDRMNPASDSRGNLAYEKCESDRMMLARLDNERDFHLMLDEANRHGVTFYPIDIRGLTVEGTMNRRGDSLITLATATDGIAVINSNTFTPALRRINEDLSSYYLLGYYPSNSKMDGTFRKIDVKVKRPGVKLRARRGYLAPTGRERAELAKATPAMRDPDAEARERALRQLDGEQPGQSVRIAAGYGWSDAEPGKPAGAPVAWVAGELDGEAARQPEWSENQSMAITLVDSTGITAASATATLSSSVRAFSVYLSDHPLAVDGEYVVRVRRDGRSSGVLEAPATARLKGPTGSGEFAGSPRFFRATAARAPFAPLVQPRFRRTERLRVVLPVGAAVDSVSGQLLDRRGQPMPVPLTFSIGHDGPLRVATGEVGLSPLSVGDYLIQCDASAGPDRARRLVAFRIVP